VTSRKESSFASTPPRTMLSSSHPYLSTRSSALYGSPEGTESLRISWSRITRPPAVDELNRSSFPSTRSLTFSFPPSFFSPSSLRSPPLDLHLHSNPSPSPLPLHLHRHSLQSQRRAQEASLSSRNQRSQGDQEVPEVDRAAHPKASLL